MHDLLVNWKLFCFFYVVLTVFVFSTNKVATFQQENRLLDKIYRGAYFYKASSSFIGFLKRNGSAMHQHQCVVLILVFFVVI